jgi:hypothetical protein
MKLTRKGQLWLHFSSTDSINHISNKPESGSKCPLKLAAPEKMKFEIHPF